LLRLHSLYTLHRSNASVFAAMRHIFIIVKYQQVNGNICRKIMVFTEIFIILFASKAEFLGI